ncbi:MAG: glycosyltransferase family 39 protein [Verrucomicrobiae bacterium]|nr:glycosyltransferase family 39 protein [Verrucomicrobiae bacterium]
MRSWQLYGIAALLWAAIFLPGLGDPELKGEEGRRILPARTMLRTGEWIVPFSEGKPYSRKPPMINWAIAASFKLTGVENEWTARLPSVLAILIATIVIVWSSRGMISDNGALVAALSFLACFAQVDKGRLAEIEALYVALTAIAMALWLRFWHREANPWLTHTIPWFFLGLAMLTKGPVHLLFVYGVVIATLIDSQRLKDLLRPPHLFGIGIMCSIFAPWAIANAHRSAAFDADVDKAQTVWLQQLTERLDPAGIDWGNYFLVPLQGIANFAPWAIFLIIFWRNITPWSRTEPSLTGSAIRGLKWGILIMFLIVSLIPESRPRFTMPLFGGAAILTGWITTRAWEESRDKIQKWWQLVVRSLARPLALAAIAIPAVVTPGITPLVIGLVVATVLFLIQRRPLDTLAKLTIGTTTIIAAVIIMIAVDTRHLQDERANVRPLGQTISAALPGDAHLAVFKPGPQPFLFYVTQDYTIADRPSQIPADTVYLLLQSNHRERVFQRNTLTAAGEPTLVTEVTARDGKHYQLLKLAR